MIEQGTYAGNFSRLHAYELAYSTELSREVKQRAAKRMLEYPRTLENDPTLKSTLERLADGSTHGLALYYATLPQGKQHTQVLRLQDHAEEATYNRQQQDSLSPVVERQETNLDWSALLAQAERDYERRANNNPYGFENSFWRQNLRHLTRDKNGPAARDLLPMVRAILNQLPKVQEAKEWTDLDILLRGLRDLGAQPLILSSPMSGAYCDSLGLSYEVRRKYYDNLRESVEAYDFPVIDFADHDGDKYFVLDPASHLSSKGWIYYAKALDAFYHGTLKPGGISSLLGPRPAPKTGSEISPRYDGGNRLMNCDSVAGRAWKRNKPDTGIAAETLDACSLLATMADDPFHHGPLDAGKGSGNLGFLYRVPDQLAQGRGHSSRVSIGRTSLDLRNSRRTLTCGPK
jgi:D-alanyl-lipoteichoic acid biosynthesis protein DltD